MNTTVSSYYCTYVHIHSTLYDKTSAPNLSMISISSWATCWTTSKILACPPVIPRCFFKPLYAIAEIPELGVAPGPMEHNRVVYVQ